MFGIILLKILNLINLLSMLMFIPGIQGKLCVFDESHSLTVTIYTSQLIVTIIITIIIGIYGDIKKVPRPDTGYAIFQESQRALKIAVPVLLVICVIACIVLKLEAARYLFACIMQAPAILNSGRIIRILEKQHRKKMADKN